MAHWTCSADYCRALAESGALAYDVTWPVRLARWWEARRGRTWAARGERVAAPGAAELWERLERAFRLLDVADSRPDPALTRLVATSLLAEVEARLDGVDDVAERAELVRAVEVVSGQALVSD